MNSNASVGKRGEKLACSYLTDNGYIIIKRNFRSKFGEIDIIGQKNNKKYFIEVKTRTGFAKGKPYEAFTFWKKQHFKKAVMYYLLKNNLQNYKLSMGVISIVLNDDLTIKSIDFYDYIE